MLSMEKVIFDEEINMPNNIPGIDVNGHWSCRRHYQI